jgi:FG-GAP-like repeat
VSPRTVASFARFVTRTQFILLLTLTLTVLSCISAASGQCSDPGFDAILNIQAGGPPPSGNAAYGDVNGDGKIDVIVPNTGADTISVLLGGTAKPTTILINLVTRPIAVGIGDFNHDGKADLAVSHGSFSTTIAILFGNGAGNFGSPTDFAANLSQPLIVADFNYDGNPDVFLGNSSTNNSQMFLGNANGTLAAGFFGSTAAIKAVTCWPRRCGPCLTHFSRR